MGGLELRVYSGVLKYRHSYRAYQFLMVPHTQIANTGGYNPPGSPAGGGVGGEEGCRRSVEACRGFVGVISPKTQQDGSLSSAGAGSHCPQEFTSER